MPDEPHLFKCLTVEEHLRTGGAALQVTEFRPPRRALIEEAGAEGQALAARRAVARHAPEVVIACGLIRDAATLLFDEPLTGLDPIGIRRMRNTIVARAHAGAAIVLSSHLLHLVEEVCTRVIIMDRGKKIADGTFEELLARADLASAGSSLEQIFLHVTGHDA